MSHPNPTYDPSDEPSPETLAERAEFAREAQMDRDAERARDVWDAICILKRARNDDLAEIAKELPQTVRDRLTSTLRFAKFN